MSRVLPAGSARGDPRAGEGAPRAGGGRAGFSLVEVLVALMLLGVAALACAAADAWAGRMLELAEAREDAAGAAEQVLDSLVQLPAPGGGALTRDRLQLEWSVEGGGGASLLRLRVRARGRPVELDESYTALWAPPPRALEEGL